jgi:HD-GYP domain-containing protein (c-di-GMP phosphodiesterase class II)
MNTNALGAAAVFFLLSFSPKTHAVVVGVIKPAMASILVPVISPLKVPWRAKYYGKVCYECVHFTYLLRQGYARKWTSLEWVKELTARLDHEHLSTLQHAERSQDLMEGFGRWLQWSEQEVEDGKIAAGIHDLGKLLIPSGILEKPAKLTDEEMAIMRRHVAWSARFIRFLPKFNRMVGIVGDHHEMYNGKGYPNGLMGNEISRVTHALAIVDAFDAMTSARHYKPAFTRTAAFTELRRCAGTQFDPVMVEDFIDFMTYMNPQTVVSGPPVSPAPGPHLLTSA